MVDTIKFGWACEPRGVDFSHLTGTRQTQRDDGTATYSGSLGSLSVWVKEPPGGEHWWVIVSGSLARFHKGTNAVDFTWAEASDALGDVEEALGVGLGRASVTRLDLAANLRMERSPADYLSTLTSISGKYKASYHPGETVRFSNTLRTISLYDKAREAKGRRLAPETLDGNVLRCEVQFRKSLRRQMNQAVTVDSLRSPRFAERATKLWERYLREVRIGAGADLDYTRRYLASDLADVLVGKGLERVGGLETWRAALTSAPEDSVDYQNQYRHLKRLQNLPDFYGDKEGDSVNGEFQRKVREASISYISSLPQN